MSAIRAEATPYVPNARDESYRFLIQIFDLLGYPREWAAEAEQRCYDAGRTWHAPGDPRR